jgi:hypothetical protein
VDCRGKEKKLPAPAPPPPPPLPPHPSTPPPKRTSSGRTLPTALAAPVVEGMMFVEAARPARQSLPPLEGPSTVSCVAVVEWTVDMRPSMRPKFSWRIFATGARQFVVQDAFEMIFCEGSYFSWLTPTT